MIKALHLCCINQNFGRRYSQKSASWLCWSGAIFCVDVYNHTQQNRAWRSNKRPRSSTVAELALLEIYREFCGKTVVNIMITWLLSFLSQPTSISTLIEKSFGLSNIKLHWYIANLTQTSTVSLVLFPSCLPMHGLQNWKVRRHVC